MNICIEEYQSKDQKEAKEFIVDIWKEFGFIYIKKYDYDLDDPEVFYVKPGGAFYLLKDEEKIIGTIGVINKGVKIAEFKRFYVDKDYRGKGYGTKLFNYALDFCKNSRFEKVEFETDKELKKGHEFYKKKGFKIVKEDSISFYMEKFL